MIDKEWMREFSEKVIRCPKCKQQSFCLIFSGEKYTVWECAESTCGYNPSASQKRFK